jgi:cytochrome c5
MLHLRFLAVLSAPRFARPAISRTSRLAAQALARAPVRALARSMAILALAAASASAAATSPAPLQVAASTGKPPRSGASVYSVSCASCHTYGMRGAPKLTDKAAWAPRLAQPPGTLTTHVIKGLGWMPPRGTCSTCTDDEIKAAVDYMVSRLPAP